MMSGDEVIWFKTSKTGYGGNKYKAIFHHKTPTMVGITVTDRLGETHLRYTNPESVELATPENSKNAMDRYTVPDPQKKSTRKTVRKPPKEVNYGNTRSV